MKTVHERERKKEKNNRKPMGRGGGEGILIVENHIKTTLSIYFAVT